MDSELEYRKRWGFILLYLEIFVYTKEVCWVMLLDTNFGWSSFGAINEIWKEGQGHQKVILFNIYEHAKLIFFYVI